jgi:hypothetical protein
MGRSAPDQLGANITEQGGSTVRIRFHLLAAVASVLLLNGCGGETAQAPIDKDKFEKITLDQFDVMSKGRFTPQDLEKVYKKHGVTKDQVEKSLEIYGEPDGLKKKKAAAIEKMTKGMKMPPSKAGGQ